MDDSAKIRITINVANLTIGDLKKIDLAQRGDLGMAEMIDLLNKAIEEDIEPLPIPELKRIFNVLKDEVDKLTEPGN